MALERKDIWRNREGVNHTLPFAECPTDVWRSVLASLGIRLGSVYFYRIKYSPKVDARVREK